MPKNNMYYILLLLFCFCFRVHVQRVTSTAALSQHLHQQVLSQQERGVIELDTFSTQTQAASTTDAEELVVGWQEKVFSQYEVDLYQTESNCQTPLERQYHTEIMAMERSKRRQNQRIFTYTDFDRFSKWEEQAQSMLIPAQPTPTFLAERMANVRHRRQERRPVESNVPKSRLITWEPSEEFIKNSHIINTPVQTMYIMGDLGPSGKLGLKENEYVLCTIKADSNGVITIKPDFNNNRGAYRLETQGEKKEVWKLYLENASSHIHAEEKEREQRMYRDLYTRHKDYLSSLVGQDFEMPPLGILRLIVNGEIVSAQGYEYDNLYVHFFLDLPNSKSTYSQPHTMGKNRSLPQWPVLYFKVLSLDFWQRYRTEGYGFLVIPSTPGYHKMTCHTWRPFQSGTVAELRRFFIGGAPELEDISYVRVPGTFKGERLSRFGFRTQTTGSVTFTLNCIQHARLLPLTSVQINNISYFTGCMYFLIWCVFMISEAFQRARMRMQEARETLPRDLINTSAQLNSESSA
uniref:Meckel syndrome type 1 protein-like n=1 Tax=Sinocyclocheilus grahami TaxID=75366 RepID=A0A672MXQ7_SINGR